MSKKTTYLNDELYQYLQAISLREPKVLQELREVTANLSTSAMQIAPEQGQFMRLLIEILGAKRTIEVGVYTGYSALSVAYALPADGQVIACDINEEWTTLAREYWEKAGVSQKIHLTLGPAEETLQKLIDEGEAGQFDFAFIDADKAGYDTYYEQCLQLIRPGGLIIIDNVLWDGKVAIPTQHDKSTESIRAINAKILEDKRVSLSVLPIGDGITITRKH